MTAALLIVTVPVRVLPEEPILDDQSPAELMERKRDVHNLLKLWRSDKGC